MALRSYFFNAKKQPDGTLDRLYNAESFTGYLQGIISNGVYPTPSTCFQVYSSNGFDITVKPGQAWINGRKVDNTTDYTLTVDRSDVVLNRKDRVILQLNLLERDVFLYVKKGKANSSAILPELTRTDEIYELCLAEITIDKQQESITESHIKDTRAMQSVCGIISGLIREIDTETLLKQFEYDFINWFEDMKNLIASGGSYREVKKLYKTNSSNTTEVVLPDTKFKSGSDILNVFINGIKLNTSEYSIDLDNQKIKFLKAIDVINTPIEVSILKTIDSENGEIVELSKKIELLEQNISQVETIKQNVRDETLLTEDKSIVGAINEIVNRIKKLETNGIK